MTSITMSEYYAQEGQRCTLLFPHARGENDCQEKECAGMNVSISYVFRMDFHLQRVVNILEETMASLLRR